MYKFALPPFNGIVIEFLKIVFSGYQIDGAQNNFYFQILFNPQVFTPRISFYGVISISNRIKIFRVYSANFLLYNFKTMY